MTLFNKNKKDKKEKEVKNVENEEVMKEEAGDTESVASSAFLGVGNSGTHKILKGFYVSEKASMGTSANQYMFKVFESANKSEVKKEVSKLFNVEVKKVKILNMPEKRRDFGKHPGFKIGFKKAIVVLKEGHTIGQAKP